MINKNIDMIIEIKYMNIFMNNYNCNYNYAKMRMIK